MRFSNIRNNKEDNIEIIAETVIEELQDQYNLSNEDILELLEDIELDLLEEENSIIPLITESIDTGNTFNYTDFSYNTIEISPEQASIIAYLYDRLDDENRENLEESFKEDADSTISSLLEFIETNIQFVDEDYTTDNSNQVATESGYPGNIQDLEKFDPKLAKRIKKLDKRAADKKAYKMDKVHASLSRGKSDLSKYKKPVNVREGQNTSVIKKVYKQKNSLNRYKKNNPNSDEIDHFFVNQTSKSISDRKRINKERKRKVNEGSGSINNLYKRITYNANDRKISGENWHNKNKSLNVHRRYKEYQAGKRLIANPDIKKHLDRSSGIREANYKTHLTKLYSKYGHPVSDDPKSSKKFENLPKDKRIKVRKIEAKLNTKAYSKVNEGSGSVSKLEKRIKTNKNDYNITGNEYREKHKALSAHRLYKSNKFIDRYFKQPDIDKHVKLNTKPKINEGSGSYKNITKQLLNSIRGKSKSDITGKINQSRYKTAMSQSRSNDRYIKRKLQKEKNTVKEERMGKLNRLLKKSINKSGDTESPHFQHKLAMHNLRRRTNGYMDNKGPKDITSKTATNYNKTKRKMEESTDHNNSMKVINRHKAIISNIRKGKYNPNLKQQQLVTNRDIINLHGKRLASLKKESVTPLQQKVKLNHRKAQELIKQLKSTKSGTPIHNHLKRSVRSLQSNKPYLKPVQFNSMTTLPVNQESSVNSNRKIMKATKTSNITKPSAKLAHYLDSHKSRYMKKYGIKNPFEKGK